MYDPHAPVDGFAPAGDETSLGDGPGALGALGRCEGGWAIDESVLGPQLHLRMSDTVASDEVSGLRDAKDRVAGVFDSMTKKRDRQSAHCEFVDGDRVESGPDDRRGVDVVKTRRSTAGEGCPQLGRRVQRQQRSPQRHSSRRFQ